MNKTDHDAVAALMRVFRGDDTATPADIAHLRAAHLVHDSPFGDPYDRGKIHYDALIHEGWKLAADIRDAREKEQALRDRLDAIAAEMDRQWRSTRNSDAPMSNVMTHPAWRQYQKELKQASLARAKVEMVAAKRLRLKRRA